MHHDPRDGAVLDRPGAADRWRVLEAPFAAAGYDGDDAAVTTGVGVAPGPAPGVLVRRGTSRVVVVAPHAANHARGPRTKPADRGTGGLALLLAERTGCTAVVALGAAGGDAAWDPAHPLKDALAGLDPAPAALLDLHGMRRRPGLDLDVGTGTGPTPSGTAGLLARLRDAGLAVTVDGLFDAMRPTTVTRWAQGRGIPALQVEIGAHLRPPDGRDDRLAALVAALTDAVADLDVPR